MHGSLINRMNEHGTTETITAGVTGATRYSYTDRVYFFTVRGRYVAGYHAATPERLELQLSDAAANGEEPSGELERESLSRDAFEVFLATQGFSLRELWS